MLKIKANDPRSVEICSHGLKKHHVTNLSLNKQSEDQQHAHKMKFVMMEVWFS